MEFDQNSKHRKSHNSSFIQAPLLGRRYLRFPKYFPLKTNALSSTHSITNPSKCHCSLSGSEASSSDLEWMRSWPSVVAKVAAFTCYGMTSGDKDILPGLGIILPHRWNRLIGLVFQLNQATYNYLLEQKILSHSDTDKEKKAENDWELSSGPMQGNQCCTSLKNSRGIYILRRGVEKKEHWSKTTWYTSLAKMDSGCDPLPACLAIVITELWAQSETVEGWLSTK